MVCRLPTEPCTIYDLSALPITLKVADAMNELVELALSLLIEFVIKLPGYLIVRCFRRPGTFDPDGLLVVILGTFFWIVIALMVWGIVVLL